MAHWYFFQSFTEDTLSTNSSTCRLSSRRYLVRSYGAKSLLNLGLPILFQTDPSDPTKVFFISTPKLLVFVFLPEVWNAGGLPGHYNHFQNAILGNAATSGFMMLLKVMVERGGEDGSGLITVSFRQYQRKIYSLNMEPIICHHTYTSCSTIYNDVLFLFILLYRKIDRIV
ncbi:hypothetical protein BDA99DRAFT_535637 [Phascolomyces articulosus]|uniref:Uncharacterized protein n=1 Tax=Phascolomyces articulosus TaxID=60185 RepID=A0AAD5K404_9FUNG|nr:hypothetical protein BDA99DRAFT_535637 [Phascolomyces articulosus]